jgi:hypothetical protein
MIGMNKHKEAGRHIFMQSVTGFANVFAFAAAFLLTPKVHAGTLQWVLEMTRDSYGYGWDDLVSVVWWGLCAFGLFFLTRMTVGTLMIMGAMAVATRFF